MKIFLTIALLLLMACGGNKITEPAVCTDGNLATNTIQYIILGDAEFVSVAFCSDLGPRDTIPCAVTPWLAVFELPIRETAFMRVYKHDINETVSIGIIQNGFFNVVDTALPGDEMAEAECLVWEL